LSNFYGFNSPTCPRIIQTPSFHWRGRISSCAREGVTGDYDALLATGVAEKYFSRQGATKTLRNAGSALRRCAFA